MIVLVVNNTSFFFSHRWNLALEADRRKEKMLLVSPSATEQELSKLNEHGITWRALPIDRQKNYLLSFFKTFFFTLKLAKELDKNSIFHLVTIIPIVFCGLPLRILQKNCVFALSGMGSMFSSHKKIHKIGRLVISKIYSFLMNGKNSRLIVQNEDDYELLNKRIGVKKNKITLIRGSGIKIEDFPFTPKRNLSSIPILLLPGRLIREKGIFEAAELSQNLQKENIPHRLVIVGGSDPGNPLCISEKEIKELKKQSPNIEFTGHCTKMKEQYLQADIILFPSYREGLPKALLEAASIGRPIVAFDVPGVRECIQNGKTGLLAKFGDTAMLAKHCKELLQNADLREKLADSARKDVENKFAETIIVQQIFDVYASLFEELNANYQTHFG